MKAYYDRRASEYDDWYRGAGRFADQHARPGWNEEVNVLTAALAALPQARTLDIACGTCFLSQHLRDELTGLDQSAAMLSVAAERVPEGTFVLGDALEPLPFADGEFERVFTGHFYGHLERDGRAAFLAEARRVAARIVVVDSALRGDVEREEVQERILDDGSRWQVYKRYFSPDELLRELGGWAPIARRPLVRGRRCVTRRRSAYRSLSSLQRDNAVCRACVEAGYPLESLPVFEGRSDQRAYILGQAPGRLEGHERRPWRGRAGVTLRRWLQMDEARFYDTFYCASVTRCFPGRHPSGRGDRTPTPREQALCAFWREWELRLLRPRLILAIGGLAAARLLGRGNLDGWIGRRLEHGAAGVFVLPHPSGRSTWLNAPPNRERLAAALDLVRTEVRLLEER